MTGMSGGISSPRSVHPRAVTKTISASSGLMESMYAVKKVRWESSPNRRAYYPGISASTSFASNSRDSCHPR